MIAEIRRGIHFTLNNDLPTVWRAIWDKDAHPLVQFGKYGFCGVLAVAVHSIVVWGLGKTAILPHFLDQDVNGAVLSNNMRALYFTLANLAGFLASDVVAYITNLLWVFHGGRHHRIKEFFYFTAVASIGFSVGLGISLADIYKGSGSSLVATIILVITAALVNFVCRKFFIFKG